MTGPKVSVVVAVRDGEAYLAETVRSVRAQTMSAWELLLVDDGSMDTTPTIVARLEAEDDRVRGFRLSPSGVSRARNFGASQVHADSRYLFFLDADDVLHPCALGTLCELTERFPNAVGAHGLGRYVDAWGTPIRVGEMECAGRRRMRITESGPTVLAPEEPTSFEALVYENYLLVGATLVRREAFEASAGFSAGLARCEDWELWIRIALSGPFLFLDEVVLDYRQHHAGTSQRSREMMAARASIRRRIIRSSAFSREQRELAKRSWRAVQCLHCADRLRLARESAMRLEVKRAVRHTAQALMGYGRYLSTLGP